MNNQNYNQQSMMYNQPMNSQNYAQQPKRKNIALIVVLSIIGVIILGVASLFVLFYIDSKQDRLWTSGEVTILGKNIQLPCDIETFESTLNTEIKDGEFSNVIRNVKIRIDHDSTLIFNVYVEDDMVTGIILNAYKSDEDKSFEEDPHALETERETALNVVFPGNVNIETSIDEIKSLYDTKPLNGSYVYFEEVLQYTNELSASHKYQDSDWSIEVHTLDGEITEINYYYLKH